MLEVEEAQARIIAALPAPLSEPVPLSAATGRVLAQEIVAPVSLPPFDNSAMDGYALRASDVASASWSAAVRLKCIGTAPAGVDFREAVAPGACVRLFTGSRLPRGADAVVMQEDTKSDGAWIEVLDAVKPWENVRFAGEDVKAGAPIARGGERVTAGRLALLGAVGIERVPVARRPLIGILGTGDELVEAGQPLPPGKIYESNRTAIASLVEQFGGSARVFPLVRDTREATRQALESAFAECEAVVTTGGVSVGEHDCVKQAFEALGGVLDFWKVAMRPGKPFAFGRLGGRFLFGLPGNPVSAFVTFLLLVRPALLRMQGVTEWKLPSQHGTLAEPMHNRGDRRHFIRVAVQSDGCVRSAGAQVAHALSSLASANGLLDMPPKTSWPGGERVLVLRWEC